MQMEIGSGGVSVDVSAFLATDFGGRLSLVVSALAAKGIRPSSLELSKGWLQLLEEQFDSGLPQQAVHTIAEEAIALQPEADFADRLFALLLDGDVRAPVDIPKAAVLVVSCEKYLSKAMRLCDALREFHPSTFVVVGNPASRSARLEEHVITVPAGDAYEDLPTKLMQTLIFVRRSWRGAGVFKIDDDATVVRSPNGVRMNELVDAVQYAGSINDPRGRQMDRCWHAGKCLHRDMTPYRGRYLNSYASGAAYYLGPEAIDILVKDYFRYRAEFETELFEDKAIGTVLALNGVTPMEADVGEMLGLRIDLHG